MQVSARSRSRRPRSHRYALEARQMFDGAALVEAAAATASVGWEPPAEQAAHGAEAPAAHAEPAHTDLPPAPESARAEAERNKGQQVEGAAAHADSDKHAVYAIDENVENWQSLVAALPPGSEVILIDTRSSGLSQLAAALAGRNDIDELHIVSHGAAGQIVLGNETIDSDNAASFEAQWQAIGASLGADGDIMLYGCDVASGGTAFLQQIADMTHADVAASTDAIGAAALGGDWTLEASVGRIDAHAWSDAAYAGLLAAPTIDANVDEVRVAEPSTINAPGADSVTFSGIWQVNGTGTLSLTVTLGDGTVGDLSNGGQHGSSLTFSGDAAAAQAWLNTLRFTAKDTELGLTAGKTTLDVAVTSGALPTVHHSIDVTVTPANDPTTLANGSALVVEGQTVAISGITGLAAHDSEVTIGTQNASQIIYRLTDAPDFGYLTLNGERIGLGSIFTQEQVNNGALVYHHTAGGADGGTPGADQNTADHFGVAVNDGATPQSQSASAVVTVNVQPVNQAPVVSGGGGIFEGQPANAHDAGNVPQSIVGNFIVADGGGDPNDTTLNVSLTSLPDHGKLYFTGTVTLSNGQTRSYSNHEVTSGDIAAGFIFAYGARGGLTYANDGIDGSNGRPPADGFNVVVTDGGGNTATPVSTPFTVNLDIRPVNDDPVWDTGSTQHATVPTTGPSKVTLTDDMLNASDVDSPPENITFVVSSNAGLDHGHIVFTDDGGTQHTLAAGATFTLADVRNGRVQYWQEVPNVIPGATDTFNFQVVDNALGPRWNADGSSFERIGGVYNGPGQADTLKNFTFTIDLVLSPQGADTTGIVPRDTTTGSHSSTDGGNAGPGAVGALDEGGTLVLNNGTSGTPGLNYTLDGIDPSQVVYTIEDFGGVAGGGWNGQLQKQVNGSWVTLAVYDTFTQADLNAGHVRFLHDGGEDFQSFVHLQASAGVLVDDGAGGLTTDKWDTNLTFFIKPTNDAPTAGDSNSMIIVERSDAGTEPGDLVYITRDQLKFGDADDASSAGDYLSDTSVTLPGGGNNYAVDHDAAHPLTFKITDLPDHGILEYNDGSGSGWHTVTAATVLQASWITGSTGTTGLRYVNDAGEARTDGFSAQATDRWNATSNVVTVSFAITNRNDAPQINQPDASGTSEIPGTMPGSTSTNGTAGETHNVPLDLVYEGSYGTITNAMLQAIDSDSTNEQVQYRITSAPEHGRIARDNGDGTYETIGVGSSFTQADVNANKIVYLSNGDDPTVNPDGTNDKFTFTLADGADEQTGREFWIYVKPTNDAPVVSAPSAPIPVTDTETAIRDSDGKAFSVADPDLTTVDGTIGEQDFVQVVVRLLNDDGTALASYAGVTLGAGVLPGGVTRDSNHDGNGDYLVLRGTKAAVNTALGNLTLAFSTDQDKNYKVQVIADDRLRNVATGVLIDADSSTGGMQYGGNGGGTLNQPTELFTGAAPVVVPGTEYDWATAAVPTAGAILGNIHAATATIRASSTNDPGVLTSGANAANTFEDQATNIGSQLNFNVADAESEAFGTTVTVTLSVGSGNGALGVSPMAGMTITGNGTDTLTLTGVASDIKSLLAGLTYKSPANTNTDLNAGSAGDVTLTVKFSDTGSNFGTGGASANPADLSIALTIAPVNDKPTVSAGSGTAVLIGETHVPGFSVGDADSVDADGATDTVEVTIRLTSDTGTPFASSGYLNVVISSTESASGVTTSSAHNGNGDALVIRGTRSQVNAYLDQLTIDMSGSTTLTNGDSHYKVEVIVDDRVRDVGTGALATGGAAGTADGGENDNGAGTTPVSGTPVSVNPYGVVAAALAPNVTANSRDIFPSGINDPAHIVVNPAQQSNEGSNTASLSGINITDSDALGTDQLTAKVSVPAGFTIASLTGTATGIGTNEVTITGTLAEINAAVNSIKVGLPDPTGAPVPTDWNGHFDVTVEINDRGNNGSRPGSLPVDGAADPSGDPGKFTYADTSSGSTDNVLVTTRTFTFTVNPVNDAPVVNGGSVAFGPVAEDTAAPPGRTVDDLFSSHFTDPLDPITGGSASNSFAGVAITGSTLDSQKGTWQYNTGDGQWHDVGARASSNALVLGKDVELRFVPTADYHGGTPPALTVVLVENGDGGNATTGPAVNAATQVDLSAGGATGGTTRYSAGTISLATQVTAVNDRPTGSNETLTAVGEDAVNPPGATVSTLFGGDYGDTVDNQTSHGGASSSTTFGGIAIVGNAATAAQGKWQYDTGDGQWHDVVAPTDGSALLLSASSKLRFLPAADFNGTPGALTVRLSDAPVTFANGTDISATVGDQTSHWSVTHTLGTGVTPANDAPVLGGTGLNHSATENAGVGTGMTGIALVDAPSLSDIDLGTTTGLNSTVFGDGTITVTLTDKGTGDLLYVNPADLPAGVTVAPGSANDGTQGKLVLDLAPGTTLAQVNTLLGKISYRNTTDNPTDFGAHTTRTYTITVNDGNNQQAGGNAGGLALDSNTIGGTITIVPNNDPPVAVDDVNAVTESTDGSPVSTTGDVINGAGTDTDVDTSLLAVSGAHPGTTGTDTAVAAGKVDLTGSHGSLTLNANGTYTYTLDSQDAAVNALKDGEHLTDVFTYTVSDGNGGTDTATLTITITGKTDGTPAIVPTDGNGAPTGQADVHEHGLGDPVDTTEKTTGTIAIAAPDGLAAINVGGTSVTLAQLGSLGTTPVVIDTGEGTLTLTGFTPGTVVGGVATAGTLTYTYDLKTAQNQPAATDSFDTVSLSVTDAGNTTTTGTLTVRIVDDVPVAANDAANVNEDGAAVTGNVVGGAGVGTGDAADDVGADGPATGGAVTDVSFGGSPKTVGTAFNGTYGSLTLNADGSYSYALDNNNAVVNALKDGSTPLTEVFTYTIKDSDGDTTTATLTVTIHGHTDGAPTVVPVDGNGAPAGQAEVHEHGLGDPADATETTTGTITITAADGLTSINVGGTNVTLPQLGNLGATPVVIDTGEGTLTLTGFTPGTVVGGIPTAGALTYTYVLKGPQDQPGVSESTDVIALTVTDAGGGTNPGTLTVRIVDDTPVAVNDAADVNEDGAAVTGNVVGGAGVGTGDAADDLGADGPAAGGAVTNVSFGGSTKTVGTAFNGAYGSLTLNADGSYSYAVDNTNAAVNALKDGSTPLTEVFSYTITDHDGETSTATLTIAIHGKTDGPPAIVPVDGNGAPAGEAEVHEHGLGDPVDPTEKTTGTITITAPDGVAAINVGGTNVTLSQLGSLGTTPVVIDTGEGTLTLTGFTPSTLVGGVATAGTLTYTYELKTAQNQPGAGESTDAISLTVTDAGGGSNSGTLTVRIVDDLPVAANDAANVNEDGAAVTGNVVGGAGVGTGDAADDVGADGPATGGAVTDVSFGGSPKTVGTAFNGTYGSLTLNADGSYSYALDNNNAVVNALKDGSTPLTEVFTYTIKDSDGDTTTATLTVTIHGHTDGGPTVVPVDGNGAPAGQAEVHEHGLGDPADATETTTGTITITAPDGLTSINVGGTNVTLPQLGNLGTTPVVIDTGEGTLTLTGFTSSTVVGGVPTAGTLAYTYELKGPQDQPGVSESTDVIPLTVTDAGGGTSPGTLTVRIVDDAPVAKADAADVNEDNTPVTGNVVGGAGVGTGDVADDLGADGPAAGGAVTDVRFGGATKPIGSAFNGAYGSLTLNADGSYSYAVDNTNAAVNALKDGDTLKEVFNYTITDHDGETSATTLTITIHGKTDGPPAIVPVDGNGAPAGQAEVHEHGLGNLADTSETATGTITITAPDGLTSINVGGTNVTLAQLGNLGTTPVVIDTGEGKLTLTGFTPSTLVGGVATAGTVSYTYELKTAQNQPGAGESTDAISLTVADAGGGSNSGTLTVRIVDDVPVAANDAADVNEDSTPVTGNVVGGGGAGDVADYVGADGPATGGAVTDVSFGGGTKTVGTAFDATYGSLTLNADGSYSYVVDNNNAAVNALKDGATLTEVFSYTITDSDGDTSTATLTVTVHGHTDGAPTVVPVDGNGAPAGQAEVHEHGLGKPTDTSETTTGTITITAPDGLTSINVGGTNVTLPQLGNLGATPVVIDTGEGTLTLTGFAPGTVVGGVPTSGTLTYTYELKGPQDQPGTGESTDVIPLTVTDAGGGTNPGTLTVRIVDDVPAANADAANANEDSTPVTGNVVGAGGAGDVADYVGADGPATGGAVTDVRFGGATKPVGTVFDTAYGSLTLNADGSYSYTVDNTNAAVNALKDGKSLTEVVNYTITDHDGDTSTTTLTITIHGKTDGPPVIVPVDGNGAPAGQAEVIEHGLTDPADPSEGTTGTVTITAPDGLQSINVGGTDVTLPQLGNLGTTPLVIDTGEGTLTLTGFTPGTVVGGIPTSGTLDYTYVLKNPVQQPGVTETTDPIPLTVVDQGGESSTGTLTVRIVDDVPLANADAADVNEDGTAVTGNVVGAGGAGDVADTLGADGPATGGAVTDVSFGGATKPVGTAFAATYGSLALNADGSYSYTVDNNNAAVNALKDGDTLTEVFSYTITDADGDTSTATLTVTVHGHTDGTPTIVPVDGNGAPAGEAEVHEHGLNDSADPSEGTTGTVTVTAPDGLTSINVGGTDITLPQLGNLGATPVVIDTGEGTLTLTGFTPGTVVGGVPTSGTLTYTYELKGPQDQPGTGESTDVIPLTVTDAGGGTNPGTLTVRIVDDVPVANADAANVNEDSTPVTGNVVGAGGAGDVADYVGADGPATGGAVTDVSYGGATKPVGTAFDATYGSLTLNADGSYSYAVDNNNAAVNALKDGKSLTEVVNYTITDSDGDTSTTTLTITIHGKTDGPPTVVPVDGNGVPAGEAEVHEHGLGDPADATETTTGTVTVTAPDGLTSINVGGTEVTLPQLGNLGTTPVVIDTGEGTLTLTGFTPGTVVGGVPTSGTLTYTYELTGPQDQPGTGESTDVIPLTVTDAGGGTSTGQLTVRIVDDSPVANADAADVNEDGSPVTGNVVSGAGVGTGDAADDLGADGPAAAGAVTDVRFGGAAKPVGTAFDATYGSLTLNADGSYSYTVDNNNAAVNALKDGDTLQEVVSYTITDHDGEQSTSTLTITIHGKTDGPPAIVPVDGNGAPAGEAEVHEHGLTDPDDASEGTTGTVTVTAPDGLQSINVGGTDITLPQLGNLGTTPMVIDTGEGTLTLTGFTPGTVVGGVPTSGTVTYTYVLKNPVNQSGPESLDEIGLSVTDQGGETHEGTLTVRIVNDTPEANPDTNDVDVTAPGNVTTGNVLTGNDAGDGADHIGADASGKPVSGVASGANAGTIGQPLAGQFGTLVMNADGSYSYTVDNGNPAITALGSQQALTETFTYTVTDADGDKVTSTLTITIHGDTVPPPLGDQIWPITYEPDTRSITQSYEPALFVHYTVEATANDIASITGRILGNQRVPFGDEIESTMLAIDQSMNSAQHVSADGVAFSEQLLKESQALSRVLDNGMLAGDALFDDFSPFSAFDDATARTVQTVSANDADAGADRVAERGNAEPVVVAQSIVVAGAPASAVPGAHSLSVRLAVLAQERGTVHVVQATPRPQASVVRVSPAQRRGA